MKQFISLYVLVFSLSFYGSAQQTDSLNSEMQKIAKPESVADFIKFQEGSKLNPLSIFLDHKSAFGLSDNDKMQLMKSEPDELGFTHHQYRQLYKNIPVDNGIIKVHVNNQGFTYALNGEILKGIDLDATTSITAIQAIDFAKNYVKAQQYKWESEFWEKQIKEHTKQSNATYFPQPELVIHKIQKGKTSVPELVYRMDINTAIPLNEQRIYVNANTGQIEEVLMLQHD